MLTKFQEAFIQLVKIGIGTSDEATIPKILDWKQLKALAERQGLSAVVLDGLNSVHNSGATVHDSMPQMLRLEWIGEVLQNYEGRYAAYEKAISSLANWYNQHGFKMMVIKGYGLSLNYPKPSHRPCGDVDIWLSGQQREADALLESSEFRVESFESVEKVKRIKVDNSHHHHTVFEWEGFTVENHYDFMNVHYGHRSKELEVIFKELSKDDSLSVEVNGDKVYLPSPNLHALFLLRHSLQDFAAAVLTLRQVLDWAFFIEKHTEDIDWEWLKGIIKEYNMTDFYNCLNAICVGDLGFNVKIFPSVQFDTYLKEKVLNDIIYPAFMRSDEGRGLLGRILFKYRRWQGNAWKQELCYHDSRWEAFWNGVWNHLLKPKTI